MTLHYGDSTHLARKAEAIAFRLAKLSADSDLAMESHDNFARIMAGDRTLVVVDSDEADAQHQDPDNLASTWMSNIKTALKLPPIQLGKSSVNLPVGGKAEVAAMGSEVDQSTLENSNPAVAAVSHKRDTLTIRALAVGHSTLTLRGTTDSEQLQVDVLPSAAAFPQTIEVRVTGDPASAETVKGVVDGALRTKLPCQPGTELQYTMPDTAALPIEADAFYSMNVAASASDAFPAEGKVTVEVRNVPLDRRKESALWYSNDPEDVKEAGNLFAARLTEPDPARLLYHHMNGSDYALVFVARVLNNSDRPAQIQIIPGDSKPELNPVLAGFKAGDQFLRNWINNSGEIVTIPPMSQLPISVRKAESKQTISGLCYLRLLSGGPEDLTVRMDAFRASTVDDYLTPGFKSSKPWHILGAQKLNGRDADVALSREVYPRPFSVQDVEYRVGGKFGFVQIGQKPIESQDEQDTLNGNFGVVYTIHANIVNPTPLAADVVIQFESNAGYSGGFFIVDGRIVRTHLLQPKEQTEIERVHVEPGESRQITILTCPLSGGSYPATLAIMAPDVSASTRLAPK